MLKGKLRDLKMFFGREELIERWSPFSTRLAKRLAKILTF